MEILRDIIQNPLLRKVHERQRALLINKFPSLEDCPHQNFLSLHKYIIGSPQRFYSNNHYLNYLKWLEETDHSQRKELQKYLRDFSVEINHAFLHLSEINQFEWHDQLDTTDNYELIRFIDQNIHPTYLRLIEAVFSPMLRMPAYFSRINRGKSPDKLDVYNVVEELKATGLSEITECYRHVVRNGIAHGGINFFDNSISYRDKQGNEETLSDNRMVRICDDLVDACNAVVLAFTVFVLAKQHLGYEIPNQLLIDELMEETKTPWWEIIGCTPSGYSGLNQLIVHARARTCDYAKVQISVFQSGYLAELFAPGYDRYFFSIRSNNSWPGFANFDGEKLKQLRLTGCARIEDYQGVIIENLIFFVPKVKLPQFINKIETMLVYFRLHWPLVVSDFRKNVGLPMFNVREAKIHRNSWGSVLSGCIHITNHSGDIIKDIRKACNGIIQKCLSHARRQTPRSDLLRYLPLGYARISIFCSDQRRRQLNGLGKELVCTIQIKRINRIQAPDIYESTIEIRGRFRIAWNRAWIENVESQQAAADGQFAAP